MFEKHKLNNRIKQLNRQIAMGDLQAMYDLAMIYLDGTIIKTDERRAYSLLQQAADAGHIQSKSFLISKKVSDSVVIGAKALSDIKTIFKI